MVEKNESREKIKEIIAKEGKRIYDELWERIKADGSAAMGSTKAFLNNLQNISGIVLPLNLIKILNDGGHVLSTKKHIPANYPIRLTIGNENPFYDYDDYRIKEEGDYRVTLIIEKIKKGDIKE